jgi:hypothetical protein
VCGLRKPWRGSQYSLYILTSSSHFGPLVKSSVAKYPAVMIYRILSFRIDINRATGVQTTTSKTSLPPSVIPPPAPSIPNWLTNFLPTPSSETSIPGTQITFSWISVGPFSDRVVPYTVAEACDAYFLAREAPKPRVAPMMRTLVMATFFRDEMDIRAAGWRPSVKRYIDCFFYCRTSGRAEVGCLGGWSLEIREDSSYDVDLPHLSGLERPWSLGFRPLNDPVFWRIVITFYGMFMSTSHSASYSIRAGLGFYPLKSNSSD